jgi:hypothetical protein
MFLLLFCSCERRKKGLMNTRITVGITVSALAALIGGCVGIPAPTEKEIADFGALSNHRKSQIAVRLLEDKKLGKPDRKPVCKEILTTQARFAGTNATAMTIAAISAADRNNWTDLAPLVRSILDKPSNIWTYEAAFRYLRAQEGKPIPVHIIEDAEILHRAGLAKTDITDAQLEETKKRLITEKDAPPVLVYVITVGARKTKGGIARGKNAAAEIIRNMDRDFVQKELAKFPDSEDLRWLTDRLGWDR